MEFNQIKELLQINEENQEAPSGPIELKDVAKYFPKNAQKAVNKMIETDRLVYDGANVMDNVYDAVHKIAKREMNRDLKGTVMINYSKEFKGKDDSVVEFDIDEVEVEISDTQDVYLGYNLKNDTFIMGFDAWLDEDDFWKEVEREAEDQGVDTGTEEWDAAASELWKKIQNEKSLHVRVDVKITNGRPDVKDVDVGQGLWYSGKHSGYGEVKKQYPDLLDIRLD